MAKVSHKQRIIDLIELNKSDVEIKKTIYNEYNIVIKLSDIEAKRNSNFILDFKVIKNQDINVKIKLVKEILNDNYLNPLTKKELVNEIRVKHNINLNPIEIKEILWSKLRNEIVYNKDEWTYKLKNRLNNVYDENKSVEEEEEEEEEEEINYLKKEIINDEIIFNENEKINKLLNELNNPINSMNLILDLIKNSKNINDYEKIYNYLGKILIESKRINFMLQNEKDKTLDLNVIFKIISEEKYRIGKSDANLLAENIIFRLKNNLWD